MKKLLLIILSTAFVVYHSYSQSNDSLGKKSIRNSISNGYHFSVGWAIQATRYSTYDRNFERPFLDGLLTPGNELQISFHITENLAVTSGTNYQVIAIHSKRYERGENLAIPRNNSYIKQISIPLLLSFQIFNNNKKFSQHLVVGNYFGKIINDHFINEIYTNGSGSFESGSHTNYLTNKNFYQVYTGYKMICKITPEFQLFFEPFGSFHLKNDEIIENVYNRFLFGFKTGLKYNLKRNEK
jgi:hypothetical protein